MNPKRRLSLRSLWVNIHLWLGLTLGVIGIAVGITGSLLVFDRNLDAVFNPQRYATSGTEIALPYAEYLKKAEEAAGGHARPTLMRLPGAEGGPVVVSARAREGASRVYIDPPTGRVLDVAAGSGFFGWAHQFHGSLTLREYWGREIVGVVGIAMLISALSGIYLWWPLGRWKGAFGFRPGFTLSRNLHYTFGFYGAVVLAMLSFTGIYLSYQESGRTVVSWFSPVSPSLRNVQSSGAPGRPIGVEEAVAVAHSLYPAAGIASIGLPAGPRGAYRMSLRDAGDTSERGNVTIFIDPKTREVLRRFDPAMRTAGDKFLALQRTMHEGEAFGLVGRIVICIVGFLPGLLAVTGTMMYLRKRRQRRQRSPAARPLQQAAAAPELK